MEKIKIFKEKIMIFKEKIKIFIEKIIKKQPKSLPAGF